MQWNHGDLYRAVLAMYGDEYAKELKPIIHSFYWKFRIAEYHIREAKDVFTRKLADDEVQRQVKLLKAMFGGLGDAEMEQIGNLLLENEAHIIAYAQTVHSVADNLASIIYYSVNFKKEFKEFKQDKYYLSDIKNELQKKQIYDEIVKKIDNLLMSKEFDYLSAFTNTIKHTRLLDHDTLTIAMISTENHGLVFNTFRYKKDKKDKIYQQKNANKIIDSEYYQLKRLYLEIGIAVNNVLIPSP